MNKKLKIAILGSTGSIGKTSLNIVSNYPNLFSVELLACYQNKNLLIKQIKKFLPKCVIISDLKTYYFVKKIKFKNKIYFFQNLKDFEKFNKKKFDKTILGISSIDGLPFAFSFLKYSNEMLIANKETIVCGGKLFLHKARKQKCIINSIDSEHYCLNETLKGRNINEISTVYLTASGGPFLNKRKKNFKKINHRVAINHPKWKMGKKISIDSATMVNKIFEIIEASILFNINANKIKIKIHRESLVHSVVVFKNSLVELIAHNTSMSIPIRNSLLNSKNNDNYNKKSNIFFNNKKKITFSFDEKSLTEFKIIKTGYKVIKFGHAACIIFNVINDFLVDLYLKDKIFFYQIEKKLNKTFNNKLLEKYFKKKINSIKDIYDTIEFAKSLLSSI